MVVKIWTASAVWTRSSTWGPWLDERPGDAESMDPIPDIEAWFTDDIVGIRDALEISSLSTFFGVALRCSWLSKN